MKIMFVLFFSLLISSSAIFAQSDLKKEQEIKKSIYPPWNKGENNPAEKKGIEFTVHEINNLPDLHGNPLNAELVIFMGGNYFFTMPNLIKEFVKENPDLKGKIFYETLPPGIVRKQLENDNTITIGNFTLQIQPDVFQAGKETVKELIDAGKLEGEGKSFIKNKLGIMVQKRNPKNIKSLNELGMPGIKLANPNPETEGIAKKIKESLNKAGGNKLENSVYKTKVDNGEALITEIHHRQTPLLLMQNKVDAGVTWISEINFQKKIGNKIDLVEIPAELNSEGSESAAIVKNSKNKNNAKAWIEFLKSEKAKKIFKEYGFQIPDELTK